MEIPKTIKIGGHIVKIKEVEELDNGDHFGRWLPIKCEIQIDKNQCATQKESTIIHEVLEAINDFNDLALDHKTLSTLETLIYQVLKDNNLI
jgi:hypothetical protein